MSQHTSGGFSTRAIHHGYDPLDHKGALVPPLYTSATFAFPDTGYGARCFSGEESGYFYTRIANPTLALLEGRLASLEQGAGAVVFGSGMGAITATLWSMLAPGDEVLADLTLYGCTFSFMTHGLTKFGVKVRHVDMRDPAQLQQAMSPQTKVVYCESPANPNMRLADIAAVARDRPRRRRQAGGRQHLLHALPATAPDAGRRCERALHDQIPGRPRRPDGRRRHLCRRRAGQTRAPLWPERHDRRRDERTRCPAGDARPEDAHAAHGPPLPERPDTSPSCWSATPPPAPCISPACPASRSTNSPSAR